MGVVYKARLYFENLSGSKEEEYFRDGITEDVITELPRLAGRGVTVQRLEACRE
jgi:TolB-like protein